MRSPKNKFMAVVSFDNYINGIGQGDILTADTAEDVKSMADQLYGSYNCRVEVRENKKSYPEFDWVTVEILEFKKNNIMKTIKTLSELAELINNSDDYPVEQVEAAIEANGWQDTSSESDYDICSDGKNRLVLHEDTGEAVVR